MPDATFWIPVAVLIFAGVMLFGILKDYKRKELKWYWVVIAIVEVILFAAILFPVWVTVVNRKNGPHRSHLPQHEMRVKQPNSGLTRRSTRPPTAPSTSSHQDTLQMTPPQFT
jgi:fumarate reductase subunit D